MTRPTRILSTKKLQPNQRQFLLNANLAVIETDFIEIKTIQAEFNDIKNNLIFTSQNAVRSILENQNSQLRDKKCFCVGAKTTELLRSNGYPIAASANDAASLGKMILENHEGESFTFFCGSLRLETLPEILRKSAVDFNEITVYKTVLSPKKIETKVDGVLFFSPSAVDSFLKMNDITDEICFCIGETTAEAIPTKNSIIANQPTVENVIIKCINHYK